MNKYILSFLIRLAEYMIQRKRREIKEHLAAADKLELEIDRRIERKQTLIFRRYK
jgi:hypothetical protein